MQTPQLYISSIDNSIAAHNNGSAFVCCKQFKSVDLHCYTLYSYACAQINKFYFIFNCFYLIFTNDHMLFLLLNKLYKFPIPFLLIYLLLHSQTAASVTLSSIKIRRVAQGCTPRVLCRGSFKAYVLQSWLFTSLFIYSWMNPCSCCVVLFSWRHAYFHVKRYTCTRSSTKYNQFLYVERNVLPL